MTLLPFRAADVVIAFAPGAQDQMMLLALALTLDPVYVGAHHLSRWLVCTFSLAIFAKSMAHRRQASRHEAERAGRGRGRGRSDD